MIKIGRVGEISGGEEYRRFAKINELPDDPPSYLILLAHDRDFACGYGDYWAENGDDLGEFINEAPWHHRSRPIRAQLGGGQVCEAIPG